MNLSDRNKKVAFSRWKNFHSKIKINKIMSKERIAICAYLSGDGNISFREKGFHYEIRFFLDESFLAERIVKLFAKEYGIIPKIKHVKTKVKGGKGYYLVRTNCKPVCLNLLSISTYGKLNWRIPDHIGKSLVKEWIKCFFDCEGYVNIVKRQIQVKSVNGLGLKSISKRLESFNIMSKVYGPYYNGEKHNDYYMLSIFSKENIRRYRRMIGFYHVRKQDELDKLAMT